MSIPSENILGFSRFNKAMNVIKWFALTVFLICLTTLGQQPAFLTNGLVAYYPFNGNVNDESGNGNDGRSTFAPFMSDRFNRELKSINIIRASGSRVLIPNSDSLNIVGDMTLSAWVNIYDDKLPLTLLAIISKGGRNSITYLFGVYYRRYPLFESVPYFVSIANGSGYQYAYSETAVMPINQWVHLACVLNGNKCSTFINGSPISVNTIPINSRSSNTNDVLIGSGVTPETGFSGQLDDLRIYNRALSNSEIQTLYTYESTPQIVSIIQPPVSTFSHSGDNVLLSVMATNAISYQWTKDGTTIPKATNSTLIITNVQSTDAGGYQVLVSSIEKLQLENDFQLKYTAGGAKVLRYQAKDISFFEGSDSSSSKYFQPKMQVSILVHSISSLHL